MNPLGFLFSVQERFVPMETVERENMKKDGNKWWESINEDSHPLLQKLKAHGETWYVRLALSTAFIFAVRWVHDYLDPTAGDDDDDEDDD